MDFSSVKAITIPDGNVSSIQIGGVTVWSSVPDYLCFTAEESNSTVAMSVKGTPNKGQAFEFSTDGSSWSVFTPGTTTITLANVGDKVYFRGDNTTVCQSNSIYYTFVMSGKIAASGNVMSLLDKTCKSVTISSNYCFFRMFRDCSSLTTAPELPATTLASYCYYAMFYGCTSLTTAPTLPSTTLAGSCYNGMFNGCTSLTTAPTLPSTNLAGDCYSGMFNGCTSLTTAPTLPATTLSTHCYSSMFRDCTSLTTAPSLPATTLAGSCYNYMFYGCTSLTTAPTLPAATLVDFCYSSMFRGCRSLTTAPALPSTTLADNCYSSMFSGCRSLKVYSSSGTGHTNEWRIPTSGNASSYTTQDRMFYNCPGSYTSTTTVTLNNTFYTQNTPV